MHLLLTDRLACPRCGPAFGLILRADEMADRQVMTGVLGCSNCRELFPIEKGCADLRPPPRFEVEPAAAPVASGDLEPGSLQALLGIVRGPGTVVLVGAPAALAHEFGHAVEDLHVVAADPGVRDQPESSVVSRVLVGSVLPFFSRSLRGVVVDGRLGLEIVREAARIVASGSRVIVSMAPVEAADALTGAGLELLVSEAGTIVAARS